MPIPVNSISTTVQQIIHHVLKPRLTSSCLNNHTICINSQQQINNKVVLNILEGHHDTSLVERWIISIHDSTNKQQHSTIEDVTRFITSLPLQQSTSFHFTASFDTSNSACYSHPSLASNHVEFKSDAQLKTKQFFVLSLLVEVIYDENIKKNDAIFLSWAKMNQAEEEEPEDIIHPLSPTFTPNQPVSIPIISVRRLSRLSLSALEEEEEEEQQQQETGHATIHNPQYTAMPIPSPRMQYTHHAGGGLRTTLAYSTSPNSNSSMMELPRRGSLSADYLHHHGCLVGSFEESLFSGRMSSMPSKPITFHCQIGVLGHDCKPSLRCPSHWSIVFPATFYNLPQQPDDDIQPTMTPYVGTVDIDDHATSLAKPQPGYRIPPQGQLQVLIKNPNKTAVKLFLIPYDFNDMPKNTKTFLRQKSYEDSYEGTTHKKWLRYAIHLQFCRNEKGRIYLFKTMRIVFTNRRADANEKFNVTCEGPKEPVYIPM
ncbi:MAG: hypothetical protein EXX96DRAFT_566699 [Benjaminiella poitrasii]|nr:MAG: hypothetical protein EXX96DRAFT_566699 [Benjaminiella poitrasii]